MKTKKQAKAVAKERSRSLRAVVGTDTYAAAVFMVVVTTMATPPLLVWSLRRDAATAAKAKPA